LRVVSGSEPRWWRSSMEAPVSQAERAIIVHKDCRLCCVSLAFNMPAGWYAMLVDWEA